MDVVPKKEPKDDQHKKVQTIKAIGVASLFAGAAVGGVILAAHYAKVDFAASMKDGTIQVIHRKTKFEFIVEKAAPYVGGALVYCVTKLADYYFSK
jgi:hypothetical protein